MERIEMRSAGLMLLALLAAGCGQSHAVSLDAGAGNADLEVCRYLERCHPGALMAYPGATVQGCVDAASLAQSSFMMPRPPRVDAQACARLLEQDACTFDLVTGGGIVGLLASARWSLRFEAGSPCAEQPYRPDGAQPARVGEPCPASRELGCEAGSYCAANAPLEQAGNAFCGTCTALRGLGETCSQSERCVPSARCVDGKCQAKLKPGAACSAPNDCARGSCDGGECVAFPFDEPVRSDGMSLGRACAIADLRACDDDPSLACVDAVCVSRPDLGGRCDGLEDCRSGQICEDRRCVTRPVDVAEGQRCDQWQLCAEGTWCDIERLTCQRPAREGERCSFLCEDGLSCGTTRTCEAQRKQGAPCGLNEECESGLCMRDLLPFCTRSQAGGVECSIPQCDDCGVCAPDQGLADCE